MTRDLYDSYDYWVYGVNVNRVLAVDPVVYGVDDRVVYCNVNMDYWVVYGVIDAV